MKKIKKTVLTGGVLFALFCLGFVSCPGPSTGGGGKTEEPAQPDEAFVSGNFTDAPALLFVSGRKDGEITYSFTAAVPDSNVRYKLYVIEGRKARAEDIILGGQLKKTFTKTAAGIFNGQKGVVYSAVVQATAGSSQALSAVRQAAAANTAELPAYDLRFGVISDTHVGYTGRGAASIPYPTADRLEKALDWYNDQGVDALAITGDITDSGAQAQWDTVKDVLTAKKGSLQLVTVLGNHDSYPGHPASASRFEAATGQKPFAHYVIGGYHFIVITPGIGDFVPDSAPGGGAIASGKTAASVGSSRNYDYQNGDVEPLFSASLKNWLRGRLDYAKAQSPGKPIFVFNHWPIQNTVAQNLEDYHTTSSFGTSTADYFFKHDPEVIVFSGHTHYPAADPTSIWQGGFTAVHVPSTNYFRVEGREAGKTDFLGASEDGVTGSRYPKLGAIAAGQGMIVSVDGSKVLIENFDFDLTEGPTPLSSVVPLKQTWSFDVTKPAGFPYTDARRGSQKKAPVFDSTAEAGAALEGAITVTAKTASSVTIVFRQAAMPAVNPGNDEVYGYRFEFTPAGGGAPVIAKQWSDFLAAPRLQKPVYEQLIGGLSANTEYTLRIYGLSAFGAESRQTLITSLQTAP